VARSFGFVLQKIAMDPIPVRQQAKIMKQPTSQQSALLGMSWLYRFHRFDPRPQMFWIDL
jgi:predicted aspartyl protease